MAGGKLKLYNKMSLDNESERNKKTLIHLNLLFISLAVKRHLLVALTLQIYSVIQVVS